MYLNCCNAEAIMQMTTRRNDFQKPIEIYGIVDIYGKSVLSEEGAEWKRHRRIVAPAFSEKSNALVWKESLSQAVSMMKFWSKLEGNEPANIKVQDTARETAMMALHVISGAGFGVKQIWEGESEDLLGTKVVPGFNTAKLNGNHKLEFKDAINTLAHGMIWVAIFPIWLLSKAKSFNL
jgi:cytochrome P450